MPKVLNIKGLTKMINIKSIKALKNDSEKIVQFKEVCKRRAGGYIMFKDYNNAEILELLEKKIVFVK